MKTSEGPPQKTLRNLSRNDSQEEPVDRSIGERIEAMARSDKLTAVIFTVAMWVVLIFTFVAVYRVTPTSEVAVALAASLVLLGGFNTASMVAMIRGYAKDKDFIYLEDILNLDKQKRRPDMVAEPAPKQKERARVSPSVQE
jgi:hypothetical protein